MRSSISELVSSFSMTSASLADLYLVAVVVLIGAVVVLAILVVRSERRFRNLSAPVYDYIVKQAEKQANEINRQASADARDIRTDAERRANEYLTERQSRAKDIEHQFEQKLEQLASTTEQSMSDYRDHFSNAADQVTDHMQNEISGSIEEAMNSVRETAREVNTQLTDQASAVRESLDAVKGEYLKELRNAFSQEIASANKAVDVYRDQRMKMIDHEIAGLVEKTTQLILQRKLTAEEHADMVHQALEEAKREGIFDTPDKARDEQKPEPISE